jgi:hypothetical protein
MSFKAWPAQGERYAVRHFVEDVMKPVKKWRVASRATLALSCLTWAAPGVASTVVFEGSVQVSTCAPPPASTPVRTGSPFCRAPGAVTQAGASSAFTEQTSTLPMHSDIAMLDYFAQRPDDGTKVLVTRDYE